MSRHFLLGEKVSVDLDQLVRSRMLVQANSGGGKSYLLRRILEQSHGKIQQLVLDHEGDFVTLREKFDYVIAAKHGGDTVADPRAAALLAEKLLTLGVSAVIDLYELKQQQRIDFVKLFLETLMDAPKKLWHPALVVVDEAHIYCPQKGDCESSAAVIDLATRGRKRGYAAVIATQRLSKLHKDAAAELNNKLIGRTGLDVDVARAADELGLSGKDAPQILRNLDAGEWFGFGPAISREVTRFRCGPVQTTHPEPGSRVVTLAPPPTAKIKALLPQLADLPAEAEERSQSIADFKKEVAGLKRELVQARRAQEVAGLKRELVQARRAQPAPARAEVKEIPVVKDTQLARLETAAQLLHEAGDAISGMADKAESLAREILICVRSARTPAAPPARMPPPRPTSPPSVDTRDSRQGSRLGLSGSQQRILNALAFGETIGLEAVDRTQLALLSDASPTSSSYGNNLGYLRSQGLLEYTKAGVRLTEAGRRDAQYGDAPQTSEQLHAILFSKVSTAQKRILRALIEANPGSLGKQELADQVEASVTSSSFGNNLGSLRSLGLIDYPSPGQVVALPVLFLEGR